METQVVGLAEPVYDPPTALAAAAREVVETVRRELSRPEGKRLRQTRERLSDSLGTPLSAKSFALVVAETAALAWAEGSGCPASTGQGLRLPGPLSPLEALLVRPGSEALDAALASLHAVAAQVRKSETEDLYEHFLADLDPEERSRHSVYLTPAPLVRMLVRSVDELLEDRLEMPEGLASREVGLLDPAAGTGAFLREALDTRLCRGGQTRAGVLWQGFEVRPGALVAASLRLGRAHARAGVHLHLADLLAEDSPLVKTKSPWGRPEPTVLVVVGNPPWSDTGPSGAWVDRLLSGYRGAGRSRNTKWLQSRYVKFLAVAQWAVERVGRGVVALVLSDGIADNLTFGGLRESLLRSFDSLFHLDLGGSGRKASTAAGPDWNVFDIQQGACALLLVKGGRERGAWSFHLRGSRAEKLSWLGTHTGRTVPWERIEPAAPSFAFLPSNSVDLTGYRAAPSLPEIFEIGSVATITARDRVVVGFDERELAARISMMRESQSGSAFGLRATREFDPKEALAELARDEDWGRHLVPYLVRPGDRRTLFAAPYLVGRPRLSVMAEIQRPGNLALVVPRRRHVFPSAWVTDQMASHRVACCYEGSHVFPLYLEAERRPNLTQQILDSLGERYGEVPPPERIFGFVYARLWSRRYHERSVDELRQDWPRIVFPEDAQRFEALARLGWKLARIHLGSEEPSSTPWLHGELPVRLPERGKSFEHDRQGRLHLGVGEGYLAPVSHKVMELRIGGYRVVAGWLRRRAGRLLEAHDVESLSRLLGALEATRSIEPALAELEE